MENQIIEVKKLMEEFKQEETERSTGLGGTLRADLPLRNKASAPDLGVWAPFS
jgi:hypothetical protein